MSDPKYAVKHKKIDYTKFLNTEVSLEDIKCELQLSQYLLLIAELHKVLLKENIWWSLVVE